MPQHSFAMTERVHYPDHDSDPNEPEICAIKNIIRHFSKMETMLSLLFIGLSHGKNFTILFIGRLAGYNQDASKLY